MHSLKHITALTTVLVLGGCGGLEADLGANALMRVSEATFVARDLPGAGNGPEVISAITQTNTFRPGEVSKPLGGTLDADATAVLVGLRGDVGHWRVVAAPPQVNQPLQPTFDLRLDFSTSLLRDNAEIVLHAVDAQGNVGPAQNVTLQQAQSQAPEGELVFSLRWDRDADLDLKVITPDEVEISARNPNSAQPPQPGLPPSPEALAAGGRLDRDSNAQCTIDGVRHENILWTQSPPPGRYKVLIDTFSMCGQASARWRLEARRGQELIAEAAGVSTPLDAQQGRGQGAGLLALTLDVEAP